MSLVIVAMSGRPKKNHVRLCGPIKAAGVAFRKRSLEYVLRDENASRKQARFGYTSDLRRFTTPECVMTLKVLIEPGEDFGFVAEVPALAGCISQGRTREEALRNVQEAITLWLETEQDKVAAPADGQVELVQV